MTRIILLTDSPALHGEFLPALDLLNHEIDRLPMASTAATLESHRADTLIIDATETLISARNTAQMIKSAGISTPLLMVLTEGGMAAVSSTWMVDDVILNSAGPAELEARLRLASAAAAAIEEDEAIIRYGAVMIDEASYTARLNGAPLNLTYKEFELLKFLTQYPGRVFTRAQLLAEVWGYDYYGGTRTVDVHVRRLRSKLGTEHEQLISTVRNVGYSLSVSSSM